MPSVSGVTKDVAKIFAKQTRLGELCKPEKLSELGKLWCSGQEEITRYHQEIFKFLLEKSMGELVKKLRAGVEDYADEMGLSLGSFDISPPPDARP